MFIAELRAAALTLLLLGPLDITAQATFVPTAAAPPSALDSIARLAISRNLGLRQVREVEKQSTLAVAQARGLFLPTLGAEARYSELSGAFDLGDAINPAYAALNQLIGRDQFPTNIHQTLPYKQETKLKSELPLFNGALFANLGAARAIRDLRGAERAAATRRLDADARIAYLNYSRAAKAVDVWDAVLPVMAENQRVAERLLNAGAITGDAVYRARAAKADGDQQRADAVRVRDAAMGALNLLLYRDPREFVPVLDDAALPEPRPLTLDQALLASQRREERLQATAGVDAARAQRRAATASFLPSVALAADYGVQGSEYHFDTRHDAAMASLVLSWNFFNGGQDAMRRQQASSQRSAMAMRAVELDLQIALDVRTAYDAMTVAQQSLTSATARVEASKRAFTLVDKRFAEGLASHLEWSDARAQLTSSELNLVMTKYAAAARVVDLERAAALRALP